MGIEDKINEKILEYKEKKKKIEKHGWNILLGCGIASTLVSGCIVYLFSNDKWLAIPSAMSGGIVGLMLGLKAAEIYENYEYKKLEKKYRDFIDYLKGIK